MKCPKCGSDLKIRSGRFGRFYGCNSYPSCNYTQNYNYTPDISTYPDIKQTKQTEQTDIKQTDIDTQGGDDIQQGNILNLHKHGDVLNVHSPKDVQLKDVHSLNSDVHSLKARNIVAFVHNFRTEKEAVECQKTIDKNEYNVSIENLGSIWQVEGVSKE